jgi:hypothetical protein
MLGVAFVWFFAMFTLALIVANMIVYLSPNSWIGSTYGTLLK